MAITVPEIKDVIPKSQIQTLSFADLLASAQRAASSPVLNMGPPSPTQTLTITPSPSQTLTLSPTVTQAASKPTATTIPISLPVQEMPYEDLIQATVVQPQPQPVAQTQEETKPASYDDRVKSLTSELERMYGTVVEYAPTASYGGRESDLTKIHTESAKKLAAKGVSSLAQLTEKTDESGKRFLINRETGDVISEIKTDRDTGASKWGDILGGVKDSANLAVQFDAEGRAIFFPVHEKTKPLGQQLLGRDLAAFIEPVATIVGAYYGGPAGAAIGSSLGQLAATGEIDPERVATATAAAYVGSIETGGYATSVGNSVLPSSLANTATAKIVGNSIINSGVSGLMAVATGGDVEKSMVTGAAVGGAIASAPDIANTLMGGETNVQAIANATGLGLKQVQEIIATSIADGVVADARNEAGFGTALGQSLVSRGVSTAAANQTVDFVTKNLTKNPDALRVVFDTTRGVTGVAVNAALNKQDVEQAVKNAAPGIVLQAGLTLTDRAETDADRIAAILEEQLRTGGIGGEGVQVAGGEGVSGLFAPSYNVQQDIDTSEAAIQAAQDQLESDPNLSAADRSSLQRFISDTQNYLDGLYQQVSGATAGFDLRQFSGDQGGQGYALVGGGGYAPSGNAVGWNFIGFDSAGNQQFDVGGESFTLFVLPNRQVLASNTTTKVFYPDIITDPTTNATDIVLTPTTTDQVAEMALTKVTQPNAKTPDQLPKPVPLKPGETAKEKSGVSGAEGAEGAAGAPGGATPGTLQEALAKELTLLENQLQQAALEREQSAKSLAAAIAQRDRFVEQGLTDMSEDAEIALAIEREQFPNSLATSVFKGTIGPGAGGQQGFLPSSGLNLIQMLDAEIAILEDQARRSEAAEASLGTQIEAIGAAQQDGGGQDGGGKARPSSEVIGNLIQGGFGKGLPSDKGDQTGGLKGTIGPGTGKEGLGSGVGVEGKGPGAGEEGEGPGAGIGGEGVGGGGEGDGGVTEITPLRPTVIFGGPEDRPVAPFTSRVTGEGLESILGAKQPLFGGDPDEQRAVWNRRSLRLRRALGL